jgi:hypothetical protein
MQDSVTATGPVFKLPAWQALAEHAWAYPALETLHIVGIALLLGNLVALELRVWGVASALPLQPLARLALPLVLGGFAACVVSGLMMFATRPAELLGNDAFVLKLGLLVLAGCNAAAFHARGGLQRADALARVQSLLSLGLWLAVIVGGRWIAYT